MTSGRGTNENENENEKEQKEKSHHRFMRIAIRWQTKERVHKLILICHTFAIAVAFCEIHIWFCAIFDMPLRLHCAALQQYIWWRSFFIFQHFPIFSFSPCAPLLSIAFQS